MRRHSFYRFYDKLLKDYHSSFILFSGTVSSVPNLSLNFIFLPSISRILFPFPPIMVSPSSAQGPVTFFSSIFCLNPSSFLVLSDLCYNNWLSLTLSSQIQVVSCQRTSSDKIGFILFFSLPNIFESINYSSRILLTLKASMFVDAAKAGLLFLIY